VNISGLISRYLDRKAHGNVPASTQKLIVAAISDRIAKSFIVRPEDNRVHVSDIANGCTRKTWYRIHRGLHEAFDATTRKKFEYGFRYEDTVMAALIDAGYEPVHDKELDWGDVVGHPDFEIFIGENDQKQLHLVSAKTTMLFRNGGAPKVKTIDEIRDQQAQYIVQDGFYSIALGATTYTVNLSDRGTGMDADYEFNTAQEWPFVKARYDLIMDAANSANEPGADVPPWTRNAKGVSYLCKGCPVTSCRNNPHHV
jgi:hypothetical protein